MADKTNKKNIKTLNIPSEVIDSEWRDDIDTDYATREDADQNFEIYGDSEKKEGEYVSPSKVSKETLSQIKNFQVKIDFNKLGKFLKQELAKTA